VRPSIRLKAIELNVFLLTTIIKIKYEGKAFIKGIGTLVEKSRRLRKQMQKQRAHDDRFESEIRSTVTTAISPNDFITFPSSSPAASSDPGEDPQAKY
jgi:hypothetical protein